MKGGLGSFYRLILTFGFDPRKTIEAISCLPWYFRDLRRIRRQQSHAQSILPLVRYYPCLADRYSKSGSTDGHYFHQDLLVARRIFTNNPSIHFDVGSRIDGFVAHVASFRSINVVDIRPLSSNIPNIHFIQADLMERLDGNLVDCCDSLSSLHAVEHFGLGRYGDRVNCDGHLVGLGNMRRMLRRGGRFYVSVPIGPARIEFNAHRVFSMVYLLDCFAGSYHIDQFSFVDDKGILHENVPLSGSGIQSNFGCMYACGIFEMTKV